MMQHGVMDRHAVRRALDEGFRALEVALDGGFAELERFRDEDAFGALETDPRYGPLLERLEEAAQ